MSEEKIFELLPTIPLRDAAFFPGMSFQFDVGRPCSIAAVEEALNHDGKVFVVTQKDAGVDNPKTKDLHHIGVICQIKNLKRHKGSNACEIVVDALARGEIISGDDTRASIRSNVREVFDKTSEYVTPSLEEALLRRIKVALAEYARVNPYYTMDIFHEVLKTKDLGLIADVIAKDIIADTDDRMALLEEVYGAFRLERLIGFLIKETEIAVCENQIEMLVNDRMEHNNREYYLREKMRVIAAELGEDDDPTQQKMLMADKINALKCDESIKEKLLQECAKLFRMQQGTPDATVARSYIETALTIPFGEYSVDCFDLDRAKKILDDDHYGMYKIKNRFIEMLAVRHRAQDLKGQIICLVGPPGVGKTSIVRSVAKAMNRKYVRLSLGGVSDEAEIRGHRKTYVGSMVGRIASSIIQAKTMNPIILLDEIDKLGSSYKGDPASALLEVLDPEQNSTFRDNYLEFPLDLSKVLFITTANDASTIPGPLYDRMEIIDLSSYTFREKFMIAKNHLIKKQMKIHGINGRNARFTDEGIGFIIEHYTKEAGVRKLEQVIASLCRKIAVKLESGESKRVTVSEDTVKEFLGPEKYSDSDVHKDDLVGVVNGLAWTSVGGTLLPIEALVMPGSGTVTLTGSLGDVMKESASIAVSYIRSVADRYGIDLTDFKKYDIHIHAPEGAVPKDGPSAGVTMATAILSAFSGKKVRCDIAMTGEISLTGRVMKIGGLREKSMAAYNAGIKTVIIPKENEADLWEIYDTVRETIKFIPVTTLGEVFDSAVISDEEVTVDIKTNETKARKGG